MLYGDNNISVHNSYYIKQHTGSSMSRTDINYPMYL